MTGMRGCQVCNWVASGKKPNCRMLAPAKCNCLPWDDKLKPKRGGAAINEIIDKLAKKELGESIDILKLKEFDDTVDKKRRGRPPRVQL